MRERSAAQLLTGIAIVLLGVGFLLDTFTTFSFGSVLAGWWPLFIAVIGVVSLSNNPRIYVWPLFIIGAGMLLLFNRLGFLDFNIWSVVWPAALILVGLSLITGRGLGRQRETDGDKLSLFALFSGTDTSSISQEFKGGQLTAIFGGIKLDLRKAKLAKGAKLEVFVAFAGAEIIVPEDWKVVATGFPLFGGFENKAGKHDNQKAPKLIITGTALFGGVEIKRKAD